MIFSVRQLQEKCREQQQPLFIAFIDLTKAFDLVSRDGLFKILPLIGCPPKLLSFLESFHNNMHGTVRTTDAGIFLRSRTDGKLFNLARLRSKTKVSQVLLRKFLFADDAALVAHNLTISLQKTKIMTQDTEVSSSLFIKDYALETVNSFVYLGSTVTSTTSLDTEIGKRIGHAATNMSKLSHRVWENQKLTTPTKMAVYCLLSTVPVYIPRYNSTFRKKHHLRMCVYKPLGDASRKQA